MAIGQWLSDLLTGNKREEKKKTKSEVNADNWVEKASKIVDKMQVEQATESEEEKIRDAMVSILLTFDVSPEGQAASILLDLTKKRVFLTDGKPAIQNFFFYGPTGFENGLEAEGKSYEIDEWALVNFLYIVHEARLAVSGAKPTVESVTEFCNAIVNKIRASVNLINA